MLGKQHHRLPQQATRTQCAGALPQRTLGYFNTLLPQHRNPLLGGFPVRHDARQPHSGTLSLGRGGAHKQKHARRHEAGPKLPEYLSFNELHGAEGEPEEHSAVDDCPD